MGTITFASGLSWANAGANAAKFTAFVNALAQSGVGGYTLNGYNVNIVGLTENEIGVTASTPTTTDADGPEIQLDMNAAAQAAGLTPGANNNGTFGYFQTAGAGSGGGNTSTGMTKSGSNTTLIVGGVVVAGLLIGAVIASRSKKRRR